jgi:hypothetical protein
MPRYAEVLLLSIPILSINKKLDHRRILAVSNKNDKIAILYNNIAKTAFAKGN